MTDRPDVPDSAVILAFSRVEFGVDAVLDGLRTPDPFGIRSILADGVVGGFFDERKGIRRAAYAAAELLATSSFRLKPV